jgi:hypothetical protein
MSALEGVANFGEGRLEVQRLVLAMGEQEVALDVEGLRKTSTRVEASPGTP